MSNDAQAKVGDPRRGRLVAGTVLLVVAGLALAAPYLPVGWSGRGLLPLLGVAFILWAAFARVGGLLVPGGVLLGVGVGLWLQPTYGPAALMFAMAGGFLAISVLSLALFGKRCGTWWTIWPALGLTVAGLVVGGGPEVRELVRAVVGYWPYAALVVALMLIASAWRKNPGRPE